MSARVDLSVQKTASRTSGQRLISRCQARLEHALQVRGKGGSPQPRGHRSVCQVAAQEVGDGRTTLLTLQPDAERQPLFVSFAGGGIYFFWQLGAVKYLREHYDLTRVPMAGASSGSLVACLSACGVCPTLIVDTAYQLSIENDIWNRRFGVVGIWGKLIRQWLDTLLPHNAHELATGRLHVIIAKAPTLDLFEVNQFHSKADLIEAVMASSHVPFVLDGKPFSRFREQLCWDGSFPDFVYFENSEYLKRGNAALIVDYSMDEELDWVRGDFLKLRTHDEIMELIDKGYNYVKRMHENGVIARKFETAPFKVTL